MTRRTTAQRGYGSRHQNMRANIKRAMADGRTYNCWRCGQPINPDEPWDLGHDDNDRTSYRGPEHRACNRATNQR